jgi:hypothetical protein
MTWSSQCIIFFPRARCPYQFHKRNSDPFATILTSDEDWHPFPGEALLPYLTDHEDETLCRHLSFLVQHKFLSVKCKIGDSGKVLVLRAYVIPYDLPGAQGKLRVRDEASVLKPARLCLRNVVPRILQDEHLWDAHDSEPSSSSSRYFLNPDTVMILSFFWLL